MLRRLRAEEGRIWDETEASGPQFRVKPHRQYSRLGEDRVDGLPPSWQRGFAIRAASVPSEHRWCHNAISMSIFHIFLRQGTFAKHSFQIFTVATARTPVPLRPQHLRAIAVPALTDDRRGLGRRLRDPVSRVPQTSVIKRRHTTRVERCHAFSPVAGGETESQFSTVAHELHFRMRAQVTGQASVVPTAVRHYMGTDWQMLRCSCGLA
jgi:hypothetical protein